MEGYIIDWNVFAMYLARAIAVLTAIPLHESAHAYVSYKLGDPTAKNAGRISMNPLHHFDPMGALCMLLVGFGWAKPVPIAATYRFKNPKRDMAISAAAGPVSNVLFSYVLMIIYKLFFYLAPNLLVFNIIAYVFQTMCIINISLAVFNLLPVPPLDGSRIFNIFLPEKYYFAIMRYERYIMFALFAVLWLGWLNVPLRFLQNAVWSFLVWSTGYVEIILSALL